MIQVALCDDEPAILGMLNRYLLVFQEKYHVEMQVHAFSDGGSLLESREKYDIIFLDIGLKDTDGITVGTQIRLEDRKVKIIYLTSFTDYMKDAFAVHAFQYVTKPVSQERIHQVVFEAITYDNMTAKSNITFQSKTGVITLETQEIQYFEYYNRSVLIYYKNEVYELPGEKISSIAEKMKPYSYEVSHKSFVVNLYQVDSVKGYGIYMKNGKMIPLSQLHSKHFRKKMHEYLSTRI